MAEAAEQDARMAMLAAGYFTVGCVLEEQADTDPDTPHPEVPHINHESAFEAGLALILDGLTNRIPKTHPAPE